MAEFTIRRMRLDDYEEVERIHRSIMQKETHIDYRAMVEEQLRRHDEASFVAEVDGKIVGFMMSYTLSGGFGIEKSAWIPMLGVDPKYMGQGIGKKLAGEIFDFYKKRGITNIYTTVRWDAVDLLSFFKLLGFDRSNFINLRKVLD